MLATFIFLLQLQLLRPSESADCSTVTCSNGGTCNNFTASPPCICPLPYIAPHCVAAADYCNTLQPDKNITALPVCENNGNCTMTYSGDYFNCTCPFPYTGFRCKTLIETSPTTQTYTYVPTAYNLSTGAIAGISVGVIIGVILIIIVVYLVLRYCKNRLCCADDRGDCCLTCFGISKVCPNIQQEQVPAESCQNLSNADCSFGDLSKWKGSMASGPRPAAEQDQHSNRGAFACQIPV